jgi:uracil-DNA glycosylase
MALLAERPGPRILLVGEALGYRGGIQTGIPFSSTRLLRSAPHQFLKQLKPALHLTGNDAEGTAAALWQFLAGRSRIPLCWNAFPFHPYRPGDPDSNRTPNAAELQLGIELLSQLVDSYQPQTVIAVGNAAARATAQAVHSTQVTKVRHPSYGGRREFMEGMAAAYKRLGSSRRITQRQNQARRQQCP